MLGVFRAVILKERSPPGNINITWGCLGNAIVGPYPTPAASQPWGWSPAICRLDSLPGHTEAGSSSRATAVENAAVFVMVVAAVVVASLGESFQRACAEGNQEGLGFAR